MTSTPDQTDQTDADADRVYPEAADMDLGQFRSHIELCHPTVHKHFSEKTTYVLPNLIAYAHALDHQHTPRSHIHETKETEPEQ